MLLFNVKRVMDLRGITKPYAFLVNNGFIRNRAGNMVHGNIWEIKVEHIEKLCLLLNCEPSDLFEWRQTEKSAALAEHQALNALVREESAPPLSQVVKDLPIEKLEEISLMIRQMKDKEKE